MLIFATHCTSHRRTDWGLRFMRLYYQYTSWGNSREPERPLVIGYISPNYFTHFVSYFIEAPLIYHDYVNYKVVVYSAVVKADAKTMKFRDRVLKRGGMWRDIYGLEEKKVASIVRDDKLDILVELTSHTANNKLGVMACHPVPLQARGVLVKYPNTTGLPTIDHQITNVMADPLDTKQKHVEELVLYPDCFLCYTLSPEARPASPAPALSNGFITFGSFNNLAKQLGLESLCVDLLPFILLNHDHMQAYSLMNISLDTFPYAGTTTTCKSLYMGVPCVTIGGYVHAHNVGVSLLSAVGLEHMVAKTKDEYIRLAIQLASDVTALLNLRMDLHNLISNSPLCNGSKFIIGLESAYRDMWRGYYKERTVRRTSEAS
ncbi:probable UDP-N-acetylglucosamine--peptide N-acetylglucosaminyltransferase SPINDLY [Tanacetum coccineum]